jgi:hypothetical protein
MILMLNDLYIPQLMLNDLLIIQNRQQRFINVKSIIHSAIIIQKNLSRPMVIICWVS